ncbi:DUF4880 domain-containing protein [Shewanella baltica]|jgi:transmembrane sensor|uniref:FecR domain-containing protein n=1 Tax=Shewanella baltica TaxID=62322 RepID=UPI00217F1153|nr:FecR domain-containing protein [Shewanella baltica]MCS6235419.1 DUF4880 domain-containing protein [Shewanella baltica]MCS6270037.1 DUF4880 domain-containing protein [Shewanella baltica]
MPANQSEAENIGQENDSNAIEAAAGWMARLLADDASEQDSINCQQWRDQSSLHEKAWQRMCQITGKFASLPKGTGIQVLEKVSQSVVSRRRFLNVLALAGIGVTATWLGASQTRLGRSLQAQYRTGANETRTFTLEDGTRLTLNIDTAVDVDFSAEKRQIQLHQGEILIKTGHESPRRQFLVTTHFGQLIALGTEFCIRQYEHYARVAVIDGAVEAYSASGVKPQRVDAGQQTRFDKTMIAPPEPLQNAAISWRHGKLVAEGMRVADFVEEIGRYRPGFTLYDSAVANLTISGVFSLQDTDLALQSLASSLSVELQYRTAYWVKVIPAR